jgi:endonuclease/exonuclease/phosphatase family metal-dependent hydrolase
MVLNNLFCPCAAALITLLCLMHSHASEDGSLRVMTFNLRYASATPPNSWPERRSVMVECLKETDPDLIGTQEGLYTQLKDLAADLPRYDWIGLGRDGGSRGEFMAVFYRKERFDVLEYDHFWLSDSPGLIASTSWGNSNRRMVTWVRFLDRRSKKEFYFVNTHLDHQIQLAREKSAALIRERIAQFNPALPLLLVGDFNAVAGKNKAYDILIGSGEGALTDCSTAAKERRGDIVATFHGFKGPVQGDARIDWILSRGAIETKWIEIVTFARNGQYPSDHFPVLSEVVFSERIASGK